ncbi:hypothetical protein M404DRAFT_138489, partial [Pisolithus tinctorius Marx 270]
HQRRARPVVDIEALAATAIFPSMQETMNFVAKLKNASLDDSVSKLNEDAIERLRNPPSRPISIENPGTRFSISAYLALESASQNAYNRVCQAARSSFAGSSGADDILSFYNVEKLIASYTGVVSMEHDMCRNTCIAYTGPFSQLEVCPTCEVSRWKEERLQGNRGRSKVAAQTFTTIPIGPQLQALYRHKDSAIDMDYLHRRTQEILRQLQETGSIPVIDDVVMGWDYLGAVLDGDIKPNDIVLMVSIDGAQLYDSKELDCWIYIWIILHVRPGGFIPGPNKPKHLDSFLFPGLHHLSALQAEGLPIWNARMDSRYVSDLYLLFTTADGPGLVYWNGMVGHSGKNGCRMYCGVISRRKTQGKHYYPALLRPRDRCVRGSDHLDIDVFNLPLGGCTDYLANLKTIVAIRNQTQWDKKKTETGLTKPPLLLRLHPNRCLGVPLCITTDIMHLAGNISDLLLSLWRGTIDHADSDDPERWPWAVLADEAVWRAHGEAVVRAGFHLPGSYDRKPRNIAEKINTQYKTWEFQLYTFALAPILLYSVLPSPFWENYCKLVRGFQIMCQSTLTKDELLDAHALLCSWEHEFELTYYSLLESRIHFVRPCVHQVVHLVSEAIYKGPPSCYAQWTMERMIGSLGEQIRQPSKPFANLAREGVRRCQVNSLLSAMPELDDSGNGLPSGAENLDDGYVLLRKRAKNSIIPRGDEATAISHFLGPGHVLPRIKKWARLRLPNGQIARSAWREKLRPPEQLRVSRNVKFLSDGETQCGEVQYFTRLANVGDGGSWEYIDVAIIRNYSTPDEDLLRLSNQVVLASTLLDLLSVIRIKQIAGVVAMIPRRMVLPSGVEQDVYCMMERPGFDVSTWGVQYSVYGDGDDDEGGEDVE